MNTDDRFFSFTCIAAALITAAVFIWSNHSVLFAGRSTAPSVAAHETVETVASPTVENSAPETLVAQAVTPSNHELDIVPAVNTQATDTAAPAASAANPSIPPAWFEEVVDAILNGREIDPSFGFVPARSEILVRAAKDGRTVVATGTHRRYKALRQSMADADVELALTMCASTDQTSPASGSSSDLSSRVTRALSVLLAVKDPEFEPSMQSNGREWVFVDPEYQALSPAQQHLLLMGRDNAKAVKESLQALYDELLANEAGVASPFETEIVVAAINGEPEAAITAP